MSLVRVARLLTLAVATVVLTAAPAGATVVVANEKYKWFYWLAFLFAFLSILSIIGLSIGYVVKVLLPKLRGRRVE